jgi:hypothetical protein
LSKLHARFYWPQNAPRDRGAGAVAGSAWSAAMSDPGPSIIDTLDDPALFQPWFPGTSWNAWRVILKAAFCIPLDQEELVTFNFAFAENLTKILSRIAGSFVIACIPF